MHHKQNMLFMLNSPTNFLLLWAICNWKGNPKLNSTNWNPSQQNPPPN